MRFAISKHLNDILILCMKIVFDVCQYLAVDFCFVNYEEGRNGTTQGVETELRKAICEACEEMFRALGKGQQFCDRTSSNDMNLALHHKYTFVSTKYVFHQNVLEIKITTITNCTKSNHSIFSVHA